MDKYLAKLPPDFHFEASDHTYWLGERWIPGVTDIIAKSGFYPFPARGEGELSEPMLRGWVIHKALDAWYKGELADLTSLGYEVGGYLESEVSFVKDTGFKMLISEVPICNLKLWYGCTPDRFGLLSNKLVMIDSKSGGECAAYHVQLVANYFAALTLGMPLEGAYLLELKSTGGRPRLIAMQHIAENWEGFLHGLGCAKWRMKNVNNH